MPVYDKWVSGLRSVNNWFEKHQTQIERFLSGTGSRLADFWDGLVRNAGTYAALTAAATVGGIGGGLAKAADMRARFLSLELTGQSTGIMGLLKSALGLGAATGAGGVMGAQGSMAGGAFTVLATGMSMLLPILGWIAAGFAIMFVLFSSFQGALSSYPGLIEDVYIAMAFLTDTFAKFADSMGATNNAGSLMADLGWLLVSFFNVLAITFGVVARVLTGFIETLLTAANMLWASLKGGLFDGTVAAQGSEYFDNMEALLSFDPLGQSIRKATGTVDESTARLAAPGASGGSVPRAVNIFTGEINIHAKSEVSSDPLRTARTIREVLKDVSRKGSRLVPGGIPGVR